MWLNVVRLITWPPSKISHAGTGAIGRPLHSRPPRETAAIRQVFFELLSEETENKKASITGTHDSQAVCNDILRLQKKQSYLALSTNGRKEGNIHLLNVQPCWWLMMHRRKVLWFVESEITSWKLSLCFSLCLFWGFGRKKTDLIMDWEWLKKQWVVNCLSQSIICIDTYVWVSHH